MGNPEHEIPYDEIQDGMAHDEPSSESATADFSDIEIPEIQGAKVIDIDTRREISKADELPAKPEQGKDLQDVIALLRNDIQELDRQIARRSGFLSEIQSLKNRKETVMKQRGLNEQLIKRAGRLNKLNRDLKEVGSLKTFWRKRLLYPDRYDQLEREIQKVDNERIQLWRERRDNDGNTIDYSKMAEENREIEAKLKKKANEDGVYFIHGWEISMLEKNRQSQKEILEKKQQIEEFEKQLAILEAFKQ